MSRHIEWKRGYYPDGSLKYERPYINGLPHGTARWYFQSGMVECETDYVEGMAHGMDREYYESGEIKRERVFVNGELRDDLKDNRLAQVILFGV